MRSANRRLVHNPGFIAPALIQARNFTKNSYLPLADITVLFEETFDRFLLRENFDALRTHRLPREKLAVILHSLPDVSVRVLDFLVEQVEEGADWLFLTDIKKKDEYYHSFSSMFNEFVKSVDGGAE